MSPIYTRPIREQLEHDRVIRQLQARYKRKHDVVINPGAEQNEGVVVGEARLFPDLVLFSQERTRHLEGTVEVETGESVHLLEARAQWDVFSRLPAPFHLYIPPQALETARRICEEHQYPVAEIWTYHVQLDQVRFTQAYKSPNVVKVVPPSPAKVKAAAKAAKTAAKSAAKSPERKNGTAKVEAKPAARTAKPAVKANGKAARTNGNGARSNGHGSKSAKPAARAKAAKKPAAKKPPASKRR